MTDTGCTALHLNAYGDIIDCPGYPHARGVSPSIPHDPQRGEVVGACAICRGPISVSLHGGELRHVFGDIPVIVQSDRDGH